MAGYVYLIGSPIFHWYKIGKTSQPKIRITELGILLPFRIEIVAIWKAANHNELERLLHLKHEPFRINGEWFLFNKKQITSILEEMKQAEAGGVSAFSNSVQYNTPSSSGGLLTVHYNRISIKKTISPEEHDRKKREAMLARRMKRNLTGEEYEDNRIAWG
jgi:hypothetical protein